ncbi:MAG TPA: GNAT family N-acetyltransferase [Pseudolysinimonas sp.]
MTDPVIRPVAADDHDAWRALFTAYGVFYETEFSPAVLDAVWGWLMDADHEVSALVAELDGALTGFAHLRRLHDTFTAGPAWSLDDLYVAPEQRGAGIARALIAACETTAHAAGGGTLRWITAADNATAQRLYDAVATRTTWVTYEIET